MDTNDFDSITAYAMDESPASLPTVLPAPPRLPTFVPQSIPASITGPRRPSLQLVAVNANPMQTRATVPALRLVRITCPSLPPPPPSIPPTGSTPIRRAA